MKETKDSGKCKIISITRGSKTEKETSNEKAILLAVLEEFQALDIMLEHTSSVRNKPF